MFTFLPPINLFGLKTFENFGPQNFSSTLNQLLVIEIQIAFFCQLQVKIWFQNRRARERRDRDTQQKMSQELAAEQMAVTSSVPPHLNEVMSRTSLQLITSSHSPFVPVPPRITIIQRPEPRQISPDGKDL
jgi:hypothetical protein